MAELTQPFWLVGARLASSSELPDWLKSARVRPGWLDGVVALGGTPFDALPGAEGALFVRTAGSGLCGQALLQDACRSIAAGDRQLILIAEGSAQGMTAALLASPACVGVYNLIPQAYLGVRLAFPLGKDIDPLFPSLEAALKKAQLAPGKLNLLSFTSASVRKPVKANTAFERTAWVKPLPGGALSACLGLVNSLIGAKKKDGLAIEVDPAGNVFATWIEAV